MIKILPANAAHYSGVAEIINSLYPENPTSSSEIEIGEQQRDPRFKFKRWIAIEKNQIVGVCSYNQSVWFDHPQKFMVWIGVRPESQRCGIGSMLFETILHGLQPFDPIALRATTTDDCLQSKQFLQKHGFMEVIRDIRSELKVQLFDLSRYTKLESRFQAYGIEIKTLSELEYDPDRNQKLYDLDWELSLSVPGDLAAGIGRRGLDQYVKYAIAGPYALPEGFFVAMRGDEYIGLSHVLLREKGVSLYQGLTSVKPQYRRLGIGLAMKVRAIAYAKATGYTTILAENDAKNIPMLTLNEKLGYIRKPDLITFEKQMQSLER
jgi:GNAT superfamily N-acetyltransferase